jgi:hypothetical protein
MRSSKGLPANQSDMRERWRRRSSSGEGAARVKALVAAMHTSRAPMTIDGLIKVLNAFVAEKGSPEEAAFSIGVPVQYLLGVLSRNREQGELLLEPLGLRRQIVYSKL